MGKSEYLENRIDDQIECYNDKDKKIIYIKYLK